MKKLLFKTALFLVAAVISAVVCAQTPVKFGVVDTERILRESKTAKLAEQDLAKEFSAREQQLVREGQRLEEQYNQLEQKSKTLTAADYNRVKKEFDAAEEKFQLAKRIYQEDLAARKVEKMQEVFDYVNRIIKVFAQREHYTLIVQDALYFDSNIDITDKILAEMDKR